MSERDVGSEPGRGGRVAIALVVLLALVGLIVIGFRLSSNTVSQEATPGPGVAARTSPSAPIPGEAAVVDSVVDGDTIRVRVGGARETVRIIGLDSPETHKADTPIECFATEAADAAKRHLPKGSRVTLQDDPTQARRDRFGRVLAHVILDDGTLFAETMIRDGYAVHFVYDRVPSIYADRLAAAQEAAKSARAGLWSALTCGGDPHKPTAAPP